MKKTIMILAIVLLLIAVSVLGWYLYEINRDHSGWIEENGSKYYLNYVGDRVSGWQEIDGVLYCFGEDAVLCSGWETIGGKSHYFHDNGTPAQGWLELDGASYFLDASGIPHTGWLDEDGARRYFDSEGKMVSGTYTVDGTEYTFREDGTMVTGWYKDRYFLEDGTLAAGWQEGLYFLEGGILATGWQTIDEVTYYFTEEGTPLTGWHTEGEYDYYFLEDGSMATGPQEIDGKTYYFSPKGIHIWLVNPWNYLHEDYEVELASSDGGYRVSVECIDALNRMLEDCRAAGLRPNLISGYRSYWDQYALYQEKIAEYGAAVGKQIVAYPNTSEHQLGLAVDIVDYSYKKLDKQQESKAVQKWLMENCWNYGFILRYPADTTEITGIIYEPWHYRYVGLEVALELRDLGITLEEYLGAVQTEA